MKKEFLQRLGGRKFLLACVLIGLGTWIELGTVRGMTMAYSTLMVGVLGAFAAANYGVSKAYIQKNKPNTENDPRLDEILKQVRVANDPEVQKVFVDLLVGIKDTVETVGQTAGNTLVSTEATRKIVTASLGLKTGVQSANPGTNP
jgi:hypothetical protein